MKQIMLIISIILAISILAGCTVQTQNIGDLKSDDYEGKTVTVKGNVTQTLNVGSVSGYILKDSTGEIPVSSKSLPAEGTEKAVKGVVLKDSVFGYYILSDE